MSAFSDRLPGFRERRGFYLPVVRWLEISMWRARVVAVAGTLHLGSAVAVAAQSDTASLVRAGDRVRVDTESGGWSSLARVAVVGRGAKGRTGTVVSFGPDMLALRPDSGDSVLQVPLAAIRRLYVSGGPGSRRRDATIGLVGGAAGGLAFAVVMNQALGSEMTIDHGRAAAIFAVLGLASGLVFGGQEKWHPVPVPGRMAR